MGPRAYAPSIFLDWIKLSFSEKFLKTVIVFLLSLSVMIIAKLKSYEIII